jgi:NAD(P)-dependent dehydrogenase (short-subunit alcohol dehydrogenase family)
MSHLLTKALDTALDRTVVPGYTKIGFWLRRPTWDRDDPRPGSLAGKAVVVTGGSSGLGKAAAAAMARLGATVHLVVRDLAKGRDAVTDIRGEVPGSEILLHRCDVSDLSSVRAFAAALRGSAERIDVLVHNAGAMPPSRQETADGHEVALATHVLGPVLMTELLRPALTGGRVVVVSSGGMYAQKLAASDPEYRDGEYNGTIAYARTKRMQVALAPVLQERWAADGIALHTMHPGWADTPGVVTSLPVFHKVMGPLLRDPATGADTIVWLAATEPAPGGGQFWMDRAPRPEHYLPTTRASAADLDRLWSYVRESLSLPR